MAKRLTMYLLGLAMTACGIALIVRSAVGAGPWDTVAVGLNIHFGLTIGMWSIISQAMVVLITKVIEKKRLRIESVIPIVIRSVFLDVWIYVVFRNVNFASSLSFQWICLILGVTLAGIGIGVYVEANLPKTPIDGLMIALHERFGWTLNICRLIIESSAAVLGYLLGGPVGLGTLVVALSLGRIIQFSNLRMKRMLEHSEAA